LNALSGKNPSAAGWFSRPIKCQILARMRISDSLYFRLSLIARNHVIVSKLIVIICSKC
jgi:hypothetical protein